MKKGCPCDRHTEFDGVSGLYIHDVSYSYSIRESVALVAFKDCESRNLILHRKNNLKIIRERADKHDSDVYFIG